MRRLIAPLIFGLAGAAVLVALGLWQMQRLAWKEAVLDRIDARIAAAPVAVPADPAPEADRYLSVEATGQIGTETVRLLVSQRGAGAGYRLISPFDLGDRIVLLDRGVIPVADPVPPPPEGPVTLTGNLHWPRERDGFTPDNDVAGNIWFARDVDALADHLGTEPILIIMRAMSAPEGPVTPLPVTADGIPNDHLNYAITWFSLALVWLGMTGFLLWRITRRSA